jgi:hypothetical protein
LISPRSALDSLEIEVWGRMIGARRMQPQCPMRAPTVVVSAVAGKDGPQVPLTEDQDPVGEFGSGGQHESFGEAVRPWTPRRDLHGVDPGVSHDSIERGGELTGSVADEEAECGGALAKICECRCGAPGWRTSRVGAGDPT